MKRAVCTLRTSSSLVLFLLAVLAIADAQPLVLPPVWQEAQWVHQLTSSPFSMDRGIENDLYLSARTNVRPLLKKTRAQEEHTGDYGYYRFALLGEMRIVVHRWRLGYAFGTADRFEGERGAVALYLYGTNLLSVPSEDTAVQATLNRSAVNRWTLEHAVPLRHKQGEGWVLVGGSLYLSRRVQQGQLSGAWQDARFDGNMVLDSTRGLPPSQTRSVGMGVHLALSLPLSEQWRVGFWGENLLGQILQRKVRRITARVQANTIVPDADGFLHAAPLISGRIEDLSRDLALQPRYTFGLARRDGNNGVWLLLASREQSWEFASGYAARRGWLLIHLPSRHLQVAWDTGQWRLTLGLSHLNPSLTKHATLSVSWSLPLFP